MRWCQISKSSVQEFHGRPYWFPYCSPRWFVVIITLHIIKHSKVINTNFDWFFFLIKKKDNNTNFDWSLFDYFTMCTTSVPHSTPDESTPFGILHTVLKVAEKIKETAVDTAIISDSSDVKALSRKNLKFVIFLKSQLEVLKKIEETAGRSVPFTADRGKDVCHATAASTHKQCRKTKLKKNGGFRVDPTDLLTYCSCHLKCRHTTCTIRGYDCLNEDGFCVHHCRPSTKGPFSSNVEVDTTA